MGLRLEAWSYPGAGSPTRLIADVPYTSVSLFDALSAEGTGAFVVDRGYPRLDELVDARTNTTTLIRAFDGATEVGAFIADSRRFLDVPGADTEISGRGVVRGLEDGAVYPFDWPENPTRQPDWVFGGDNTAVANPGFEDGEAIADTFEDGDPNGWGPTADSGMFKAPADFEVLFSPADARSGDYCLRFDPGRYHSGVTKTFDVPSSTRVGIEAWLRSETTGQRFTMATPVEDGLVSHLANDFTFNGWLMVELDGAARNPAANGTPGGATDGTWQRLFLDITTGPNQTSVTVTIQYDQHKQTNGPVAYVDDITLDGDGIGMAPFYPVGSLDVFRLFEDTSPSAVRIRTGDKSGQWRTASAAAALTSGIGQRITSVGGRTVTGGMWVYHEAGANRDFRVVLKSPFTNSWIASKVVAVPSGEWTRLDVTGLAEGDETLLELRYVAAGASPTVWTDDWFFYEGQSAATAGAIFGQMLDAAQARGALTWLSRTFTESVDSFGNPWSDTLNIRITRGASLLEVAETLYEAFGVEYGVVPDGSNGYEVRLADPGLYRSGLSPVFKVRAATAVRVDIDETVAPRSAVAAEVDEGWLREDTDTTLETAVGRVEAYVYQPDIGSRSLARLTGEFLQREGGRRGARAVTDRYLPGRDFGPGDVVDYETAGTAESVRVSSTVVTDDGGGPICQITVEGAP